MENNKSHQKYKPSRLRKELFAAKKNSQRGFFETIGSFSFSPKKELADALEKREFERLVSMVDY